MSRLPLTTRPKALVSSAMALLDGTRRMLEAHFGCPVIDIYSLNETGPIAVAVDGGFALLHHRLYVEIVRADGTACEAGERGEITVSGGFSPFLSLLRYRTGDFAAFAMCDGRPMLTGLEGRQPVVFRDTRGNAVNNIDVSHALKPFALAQYQLHQSADGALRLRVRGAGIAPQALRRALAALFGDAAVITIEEVTGFGAPGDKVVQYTSDLVAADGFS
ncbi:MAG: hypothetical protein HZB53_22070 [Chloroflexi bacterium]|nr:hypothetical protein [Chloroflexota bacterium]